MHEEDYEDDSERELAAIQERVESWFEEFVRSPQYAALSESQKERARGVVQWLTEYGFRYLGLAPEQWDRRSLSECCVEILPRKVTAERAFFEAVAPVLGAFFTFLAGKGLLPHGHELAKTAVKLDQEIVVASQDPGNWGMAKSFAMAAQEAGVDLRDQNAMSQFMAAYNKRLLAQQAPAPELPSASLPPGPAPVRRLQPKVGRNDPCPCGSGKKFKKCCGA